MRDIGVQSLPLHKPVILRKDRTLKEAARAMRSNNVGSVLVSDGDGMLKGLFTDRDLALTLALENNPPTTRLEDATPGRIIYVSESSTLKDVVNTMIRFSIRRVPVVHMRPNGKQRCLGIITLDDLVKNKLIDLSDESRILKSQLPTPREKTGRGHLKSIFHSQGRKDQSYHTFMKTMEGQTSLNRTKSQILTTQVMTMILRRLPETQGQHLLAQLPYELQMQLLSNITPADRTVSGKLVLSQIQKTLRVDESEAKFLLERFWASLEESLSSGEIRNLSRELPKDFMSLFLESARH
jgi:IMP dehydrogenase